MLEFEQRTNERLQQFLRNDWDCEVVFWKDLKCPQQSPATGTRGGRAICGEVHDHAAYVTGEFCSHAGLFATMPGLCRTLLKMNESYQMIAQVSKALQTNSYDRFVLGFDRMQNGDNSLAGRGCSTLTFGHLGFTGTSFWIDPQRLRGQVIFTNATQNYCYERTKLNQIRTEIGSVAWATDCPQQ